MSNRLCIETIAVKNRRFLNLEYHQARLNHTRQALWGYTDTWNLTDLLSVPDTVEENLYKCRVVYSNEIHQIQWEAYTARVIHQIKKVYDDTIAYPYKYEQRPELTQLFAQRGQADEILIIKKGMVTDSFVCNVALFDGSDWYTPHTYLLPGTQRSLLLDKGIIHERTIAENDLDKFDQIRLFNAMVGWEMAPTLSVKMIE